MTATLQTEAVLLSYLFASVLFQGLYKEFYSASGFQIFPLKDGYNNACVEVICAIACG